MATHTQKKDTAADAAFFDSVVNALFRVIDESAKAGTPVPEEWLNGTRTRGPNGIWDRVKELTKYQGKVGSLSAYWKTHQTDLVAKIREEMKKQPPQGPQEEPSEDPKQGTGIIAIVDTPGPEEPGPESTSEEQPPTSEPAAVGIVAKDLADIEARILGIVDTKLETWEGTLMKIDSAIKRLTEQIASKPVHRPRKGRARTRCQCCQN